MSSGAALDVVDAAAAKAPYIDYDLKSKSIDEKQDALVGAKELLIGPNGEIYPTVEEWTTLRRVYGKVSLNTQTKMLKVITDLVSWYR